MDRSHSLDAGRLRLLAAAMLVLALAVGAAAAHARTGAARGTVDLRSTPLGKVLVSANGHTLYLFEHDRSTKSTCYGKCAANWPPLLVGAKPTAGPGVKASLLGTTRRRDGKLQVTYRGHPLYWFGFDRKAGQTKGQGLDFFGGEWWALGANGVKIEKHSSSNDNSTTSTSTTVGSPGYPGG